MHGGALLLIGSAAGRLLMYAANIVLARVLPSSELGLYFLGLGVAQAGGLVASLGLDLGLLRYAPRWQQTSESESLDAALQGALLACALVGITAAAVLFWGAPYLSLRLHQPGLAPVLRTFALALPFLALHRVVSAAHQGLFRIPAAILVRNLMHPGLFLVIFLFASRICPGGSAAAAAQGAALAATVIVGLRMLHQGPGLLRRRSGGRIAGAAPVLRFSLPLLLAAMLGYVALWMDSFLVGYFLPAAAVGRYGVAFRLCLIGTILLEAFNGTLGPAASRLLGAGHAGLEEVYRDTTRLGILLYLPLLSWLLVYPQAPLGLFGAGYTADDAVAVTRILALGQLVNVAVGGAGMLLVMAGRPWLNLANGLGMVILTALGGLLLIPRFGLPGAALAGAAGVVAVNLARWGEIRALLGISPFSCALWKPAVAFGAAMVVGVATHLVGVAALSPWPGLLSMGASYVGLLLWLRLEPPEQRLAARWLGTLARCLPGRRGA